MQSRVFDVEYAVNESALPLDSVRLWYTLDRGASWHLYGVDEDRQSPISFHAPAEGLYGLFVVLANATGPSSGPPAQGTQPHQWAFVDYTPPVVQLHELRPTTIVGQRAMQIRWTAIDGHLTSRPVELFYRRPPDRTWYPITPDPLANTGRYDWRLPEDLFGPVAVRLLVSDQGGHRAECASSAIELPAPKEDRVADGSFKETALADEREVRLGPDQARALRLLAAGREYRDRGELRPAIGRMREAVKADPMLTDAFAEMAAMLYRMGDSDRALEAYEIALSQRPSMRSALRGAAMIHGQKRRYGKAAELLQTILRYHPNDAEVWMNLGDIAVFQGDEVRARECYRHATCSDPEATKVIKDARKRLDLMAEVARTYHEGSR